MRRDACSLPADETGRVLDRLAGLEKVIPPEAIRQALLATARVNRRACPSSCEVIRWVVLAMGLFTESPIRSPCWLTGSLRHQGPTSEVSGG
jgi:hypothetical protein